MRVTSCISMSDDGGKGCLSFCSLAVLSIDPNFGPKESSEDRSVLACDNRAYSSILCRSCWQRISNRLPQETYLCFGIGGTGGLYTRSLSSASVCIDTLT